MSPIIAKELRDKLEKLSNLPSMPQIIIKIKQISENPKSSVADLANVILSDHQLTSRILRMANSSYYSDFSGRINTITHAIVLMGFRAVRNIAISMAIYGAVNKICRVARFELASFWTRSLACGVIAKFLAHRMNQHELIEAAFIAGFMHDIGQVILAGVFPEKYDEINTLESPDVHLTETVLMGINHLEAGGYVARKWNLPEDLVKAIAEHHRLDKDPDEKSDHLLVDLVFLADRLYPFLISGAQPTASGYQTEVKRAKTLLDISEEIMAELLSVCREQVAEIAQDLEIDIAREFEKRAVPEENVADIYQQLGNKEVQLAFLQNATVALMEARSEDEILQILCETVFCGLRMGRVILFEYNSKSGSFAGCVGFGMESQQAIQALSFKAREGLFKCMREEARPVSVVDANRDVYSSLVTPQQAERLQARAFAAVPVKIFDEVRFVVFADAPNRENPVNDETLRSMVALAGQGALTLERFLLKAKLKDTGRNRYS